MGPLERASRDVSAGDHQSGGASEISRLVSFPVRNKSGRLRVAQSLTRSRGRFFRHLACRWFCSTSMEGLVGAPSPDCSAVSRSQTPPYEARPFGTWTVRHASRRQHLHRLRSRRLEPRAARDRATRVDDATAYTSSRNRRSDEVPGANQAGVTRGPNENACSEVWSTRFGS